MANQNSDSNDESIEAATPADEVKSLSEVGDSIQASSATGEAIAASHAHIPNFGRYRWVICALLFFATTINYVDRQVLGILAPTLQNGPALFEPHMIEDPLDLAQKLRAPTTPAQKAVAARLSPQSIKALNNPDATQLKAILNDDLNRIAGGAELFNPAQFQPQNFSRDLQNQTERYQKKPPKGDDLVRYNHWIVEESFPGSVATSMRWNDVEYGYINSAFSAAYAIGMLVIGGLLDRFGVRIGYAAALFIWSLASISHAFAGSAFSFGAARFALGLGESANFPAAIKTVAEWFPKKERALCTGIFNAGANVGAIVAPLFVPYIALNYGWQDAFIVTGALGMVWIFFWLPIYRAPQKHPKVSPAELQYIQSDPADPVGKMPWASLLGYRQTWAILLGRMMSEIPWSFYLFWGAKFLDARFGVSLKQIGLPLIIIYGVADFGSIGGGFLSSTLIKRGWSINAARKISLLTCALCVVPVIFAPRTDNMWVAVGFIALAAAAHQGWSANYFTLASDMFPRRAVGSITGMSGFMGAIAVVISQALIGNVLDKNGGNYMPIFFICGFTYLAAIATVQVLAPKLEPVKVAA